MDKIFNIKYVDAHYSYEPDLHTKEYYSHKKDLKRESTSVFLLDAYGFVERYHNDIVVAFIKKRGVPLKETIEKKEKIAAGLIIPDGALLSVASSPNHEVLKGVKIGSRLAVTWRDISVALGGLQYDCSIMYTEGTLHKIEKDHIVLKDTETIRTHPLPVVNHPAGKPMWYTIPISFIKDIELIS